MGPHELTAAIVAAITILFHKAVSLLIFCVVAGALVAFFLNVSPSGRDDTDKPNWFGKRSGMKLLTDYGTGCQYLVTPAGHLTPRLDAQGKHACIYKENTNE